MGTKHCNHIYLSVYHPAACHVNRCCLKNLLPCPSLETSFLLSASTPASFTGDDVKVDMSATITRNPYYTQTHSLPPSVTVTHLVGNKIAQDAACTLAHVPTLIHKCNQSSLCFCALNKRLGLNMLSPSSHIRKTTMTVLCLIQSSSPPPII